MRPLHPEQLPLLEGVPVSSSVIVVLDEETLDPKRRIKATPCGCVCCQNVQYPVVYMVGSHGVLFCETHIVGEVARLKRKAAA